MGKRSELGKMKREVKRLDAECGKLYKKAKELEDAIAEIEKGPALRALVGRCFRYKNSYSCPEKPSDYWWLYKRVLGVKTGRYEEVFIEQFETDKNGETTILHHSLTYMSCLGEKISRAQYDRARKRMLTRMGIDWVGGV